MPTPLRPPPSTLRPGSTVWAYLRDSGGSSQDRSIEQQREIILEYCGQHKLQLVKIYSDLHKSGGSTATRDDFNQMIAASASESLRPQGLLIWNFARFARDVDDAQIYKGILRKRGVIIHSITDPIPEGPFANVIETLIHTADEQKKREAAIGAWRGLRHIVQQGAMPGTPPRGFKREPLTVVSEQGVERQAHRWVPDPDLAPLVLQAFTMRAAKHTLIEIHRATRLYGSLNSYATFFSNKLYKGVLEFGALTIENYCTPVVPPDLWEKVQKVQARFAQKRHVQSDSPEHPRRKNSSFLLSGIVKCARCKSPLYGHSSPQRNGDNARAYHCTRRQRRRDCDMPSIPAYVLENSVLEKLQELFNHPDQLLVLLQSEHTTRAQQDEQTTARRKTLERDLTKLRRKITNLTAAIEESGHSKTLLDQLSAREADALDMRAQLADLPDSSSPHPDLEPDTVKENLAYFSELFALATPEERPRLLRAFVLEVIVDRIENRLYGKIEIILPATGSPIPTEPDPSSPADYPPLDTVPTSHSPVGALDRQPPCGGCLF